MLQDIDFLPADYHLGRRLHQKRLWRRSIATVCLLLIGAGTIQQIRTQHRLIDNREQLERQARRVTAELGTTGELESTIQHLDRQAGIRALLALTPSPTRLLATVTEALPEYVSIKKIHFTQERRQARNNQLQRSLQNDKEKEEDKKPHATDLERLLRDHKEEYYVIAVNGVAPDDVAVSEFVRRLRLCGLFDDIRFLYSEEFLYRNHPLRQFELQLRLRAPKTDGAELSSRTPSRIRSGERSS